MLEINNRRCVLSDVDLLIYRRPIPVFQQRKLVDFWLARMLDFEWETIESALSLAIRGVVVNPINSSAHARNKVIQLKIAKSIGFNVPETLITTVTESLNSFLRNNECITKGIGTSYAMDGDHARSAFTSNANIDDGAVVASG